MSRIYFVGLIFLLFACSKQESLNETTSAEEVVSKTINAKEFQSKINGTQDPIILDVRTPGEYSGGYIEGAINLDYKASDFTDKINELDKEATYFVYCGSGGRSRGAANLMKSMKFKEVYDLEGGITQWKANNLPTRQP